MMNQFSKNNIGAKLAKSILYAALLPLSVAFVSCSDTWDEHYEAAKMQEGSLWENISSDAQLSNFARVLKATGYDISLGSSQVFTVFAPTNDCFSSAQADSIISLYQKEAAAGVKKKDNAAIKEFVQNHIALYNYSVSSSSNDSITMMNGKYLVLGPDNISNTQFATTNKRLDNGVLFTLKNKVNYTPNVFEYFRTDPELDSVATFLNSYNVYEFDEKESVPGDIVDGRTIYLDSVMVLTNDLFDEIGSINDEDSTYWMLAPNNETWNRLIPEYTEYFNYANTVNKRDSLQNVLSRLALLKGTVFSRTINTDRSLRDSAMSTNAVRYDIRQIMYGNKDLAYYQYDKPFETGGIFASTENHECSNGQVMKPSVWPIDKKQTFFQTIIVEAESRNSLKEVDPQKTRDPLTVTTVASNNPFYGKVSGNSYAEVVPISSATNPSATFYFNAVLSNIGYDIYIVTAPALAGDTLARAAERAPIKFRYTLGWYNQSGVATTGKVSSTFESTPDVVDTILIAEDYKFPTCSYGISPQVTLTIDSRVSTSEQNSGKFQRRMRIDCFLLKPHEE